MYADRVEAPERGLMRQGCLYSPLSLSSISFSLSHSLAVREWGTCHDCSCFQSMLGSDHIWDFCNVYAKRGGGTGNNQNTSNILLWVHIAFLSRLWAKIKQHWRLSHWYCYLWITLLKKGLWLDCLSTLLISFFFSEVTAGVSWSNLWKTSCATVNSPNPLPYLLSDL